MKRVALKMTLAAVFALAVVGAQAKESLTKKQSQGVAKALNSTETTGDCVPSLSQFDIDINNVRAKLLGGGDMWWDLQALPKYNVPKATTGANPLCSIFAGAIWISGLDAGGNLKCAAQRYRDEGNDYWPGPLTNGTIDQATCSQYDVHFNCYGADIAIAQTVFQAHGAQTTSSEIPNDVLAWPATGNPFLASNPTLLGTTYNISGNLAPFFDNNGDGIYDPTKGDYPVIPTRRCQSTAYADQMVFWVFNDVGNIHTQSNGQAIGVQVNALAFSFATTNDLNNMTFYEYEITNESTNKLFQTFISQWVDPDLGCALNDCVGVDTTRKCGYCYNGSTPDDDCLGEFGYITQLPQVGVTFFEGPLSDSGAEIGLTSFVYFTNGATQAKTDPITAAQYRNYQTGFWADGTPFTEGLSGYGGTIPTHFCFPGNPADATQWSECNTAAEAAVGGPGDRRFVESSGPFTLTPGVVEYVTIGIPWTRPTGNGVGLCPDINTYLGPVADEAQALFNTCFQLLSGPDAPTLSIRELSSELIINMVNLPGSNNIGENYSQVDGATEAAVDRYLGGHGDSTYKFQGYILQLAGPTVSASDLNDNTKAVAIAQCDIKDSIATIINYIKDPTLGLVPTLEVKGSNTGIVNSFDLTTDAFAQGTNNQLVNHTLYYYAAIAYAYNDYLAYDPNNPTAGGQLLPYLQGRNNFVVYEATPHIIDPRNDGTIVNSVWGQGTQVNRIEGQGNGGNNLELTPAAIQAILNSPNFFIDTLAYLPARDPIGFQITDPVALVEADFELRLVDSPNRAIGDSTRWLLHDLTNNDTIWSDRTLDRPYQQQVMLDQAGTITDYGFSIKLGTPAIDYTIPARYIPSDTSREYVYDVDPSQSSLAYSDSFNPWLSFVQSTSGNVVTNWIRTGTTLAPATITAGNTTTPNPLYQVFDASWYTANMSNPTAANAIFDDSNSVFNTILNGAWGPYCLAANYSNKKATIPYVYGPGFKWFNLASSENNPPINTLDKVAGVDVVITGDKSKWSQCVVFEAGEDPALNQGAALYTRSYNTQLLGDGACKGQIRMAYSEDWNNPSSRDYLVSQSPQNVSNPDTGRSWFPGYAINVETGERLNIAFSESSDLADENGADMLWDPTADEFDPVFQPNAAVPQIPYWGGKHFIYVMSSRYDGGTAAHALLMQTYDSLKLQTSTLYAQVPKSLYPLHESLMWTAIPFLTQGYTMNGDGTSNPAYIPPSDITIKLRVEKPYKRMATVATTGIDSLPRYQFSTKGLGVTQNNQAVAKSALDLIRVVPNPYLAYSAYETNQITNTVYVTNLPNTCTVTIYSLDGKVIRVLNRAIGVNPSNDQLVETTSGLGTNTGGTLNENSISWDLTNQAGIMVASGVYLFNIEAPGIGSKTVKWFGVIRPADTTNY